MSDPNQQLLQPEPRRWRLAPDAWRLSGRVTPERLNKYLRYRTARGLPRSLKARFLAMRIPEQSINDVLGGIRGLSRWMDEWNLAAQRFLTEARGEERAGRWQEAAVARINAAMCFHIAHLVTDTDPRTLRTLRASSVTTFAQAVPRVMPDVRRISLPWRNRTLPAYVALPTRGMRPYPLFVFLNGATTCKEELLLWSTPLLDSGIAVMTLDWPGTGESASFTAPFADCDDITDGIFDFVASTSDLDPAMVAIGGVSLGGSVAIRCAAYDRRLLGAMAVTPAYDPMSWWGYVNPLVHLQLMTLGTRKDDPAEIIAEFGLVDLIPRLRSPALIFGAGRDMVVPPDDSIALASAAGELATLVWYPNGGHGLYEELSDWLNLTATWINGLVDRVPDGEPDWQEPSPERNAQAAQQSVPPQVASDARQTTAGQESMSTRVDRDPEVGFPSNDQNSDLEQPSEDELELDLWDDD